jgi:hypothetical protein
MEKYIQKFEKSEINELVLNSFRITDETSKNYFEFCPEWIPVEDNIYAEDLELIRLINKSKPFFIDDNLVVNSYEENGHEIILGYLDISWFCGTKEDLLYFVNKYVVFEKIK